MVDLNFTSSSNMNDIVANDPHYNLAPDICVENCNSDSQGLTARGSSDNIYEQKNITTKGGIM